MPIRPFTKNPAAMGYIEKLNTSPVVGSSTDTLWHDAVTTDDKFIGNRKYLFIINARIRGSESNKTFSFQTVQDHDGSELTYRMNREPQNSSISHSYNAATVFTPKADTTVSFQQRSIDGGGSFPTTVYCSMVALDITDLKEGYDYFYETDTSGIPTPTLHTTSEEVRIDYTLDAVDINAATDRMQEKAGTWMFIGGSQIDVESVNGTSYGMSCVNSNGASASPQIFVQDQYQFMQEEGEDLIEQPSNFLMMPVTVPRGDYNHLFQLKTWDSVGASGVNSYKQSYIIGLRLEIFKDVNSEYDDVDYSNDVAIEQTVKTWNPTHSQSGKYLVLCCGVFDCGGTNANFETSFDTSATDDIFSLNGIKAGRSNDFKDELPFVCLGLIDVEKGSADTYSWRFNKYTASIRGWEDVGYVAFSLTYDYEDFYDKLEIIKVGEVRRKRSSPTIPSIG